MTYEMVVVSHTENFTWKSYWQGVWELYQMGPNQNHNLVTRQKRKQWWVKLGEVKGGVNHKPLEKTMKMTMMVVKT